MATFLSPKNLNRARVFVNKEELPEVSPLVTNALMKVSKQMNSNGNKMGKREIPRLGNLIVSLAEITFMSSNLASSESLNSMGHFKFAHLAKKYPEVIVNSPTIVPAIIMRPMGMCISPIRKRGPGAGGTREFAIAAPAIIHNISKR